MPLIIGIIFIILAIVCAVISLLQFLEKGFLFNNAYLWASKPERRRMEKKPYYRQSAIVFGLVAAAMLFLGLECILNTGVLMIFVGLFYVAALVYAIVSAIRTESRK